MSKTVWDSSGTEEDLSRGFLDGEEGAEWIFLPGKVFCDTERRADDGGRDALCNWRHTLSLRFISSRSSINWESEHRSKLEDREDDEV